jgi:hypothetical protein
LPWAERSLPFAQLSAEESALQLLCLVKVQVMKMQRLQLKQI